VSGADWRDDLRALVDRAAAADGRALAVETRRSELERLSAETGVPRLVVEAPVLGAVPAEGGWVAVLLAPKRLPVVLAARTLGALIELARESADLAVAAIGRPSCGEVDASSKVVEVIEVDPVASFSRIAGRPLRGAREDEEGVAERRDLLARTGLVPPAWFRGSDFGEEDLLDACAAAWTAVRRVHGDAERAGGGSTAIWV
jgi:hypothetical protein